MTVKVLDISRKDDVEKWDDFVIRHGQLYQHSAWVKILSSAYNFKSFYLYIENDGKIVSVFPLFYVKLPHIKDELMSIPHIEAGGMINTEYHRLYFEYIYKNIKAQTISIYQVKEPIGDFIANTNEVIMVFELPDTKEEIFARIKSKSERKRIRNVLGKDFEIVIGNDSDLILQFYRLYLKKMKEFGTPPHRFEFIKAIPETFRKHCRIIAVKDSEKFLGAEMHIFYDKFMISLYLCVPRKFLKHQVGVLLNYKTIELALQSGVKYLTFGRCQKGSNVFSYKTELGAKPLPLYIYKFRLTGSGYRDYPVKTIKQRYKIVSRIWSILPPLITDNLGPRIRKWVY
jgi:hypothetical protein